MYTELVLGINLKEDVPNEVVDILTYMLESDQESLEPTLPDHNLFRSDRWKFMLRCDSYYFAGFTHSEMYYDDIGKQWEINIRCNLKNYDNEIEKFINWISPYVESRGYAGYMRYEECSKPTEIYF